jgi:hypothetical protein
VRTVSSPADPWLAIGFILSLLALTGAIAALLFQRVKLSQERNTLLGERNTLLQERDRPSQERRTLLEERSALLQERNALLEELKRLKREPPGSQNAEHQRDILAEQFMDFNDLNPDEALVGQARETLERVGYQMLDPVGERFDPLRHEAFRSRPTSDARLDGVVASTVRVGYRRGEHVMRVPQVTVYSYSAGRQAR